MHQVRKDNAENMLTISLWPANAASGSAHLYSPCFAAPDSPSCQVCPRLPYRGTAAPAWAPAWRPLQVAHPRR